jgi:outer membrane protein assembly factor BamE
MRLLLCLFAAAFLAACSYVSPYRIEVQQGNWVTQEGIARVKIGMSKGEVRSTLGTPLLQDVFHSSRWDYFYSREQSGQYTPFLREKEQRRITLVFENDKLARIEGDLGALPSDKPVEKK